MGILLIAVVGLLFGLSACSSSGSNDGETPELIWNYLDGPYGPDVWANLSPDFATCGSGQEQSPIDIDVDPAEDIPQLSVDYVEEGIDLENTGVNLIFHTDAGGKIQLDGVDYFLKRVEFHVPAEHKLHGVSFPAEVQFFHESSDGRVAIVALWLVDGQVNKALSTVIANAALPPGGTFEDINIRLNPDTFLPSTRHFYRYQGSLSQPPCTEGVTWIVLQETGTIGASQETFIRNLVGPNARPVQPLNGRSITQQ